MTQKEFEDRTGLKVTPEEFNYIHALYMNTVMDKDEFCKDFKKQGGSSIMKEVHAVAVNFKISLQDKNIEVSELVDFLIGKACTYEDPDFYKQAVKMVGQREVTLRKIKMSLPLWEEDMDYITMNLK